MPLYDYECSSCNYKEEILHKVSETISKTCPKCGKETFEKQLSSPGQFNFNGEGFYETDFKHK